jgi:hypothetical protein
MRAIISSSLILYVQGEGRTFDLDGCDEVDDMYPKRGRSQDLVESEVFGRGLPGSAYHSLFISMAPAKGRPGGWRGTRQALPHTIKS